MLPSELALLHSLTMAISEAADLEEALARVLETVCRAMHWRGGMAFLIGAQHALVPARAWTEDGATLATDLELATRAHVARVPTWRADGDAITVAFPLLASPAGVGVLVFEIGSDTERDRTVAVVSVVTANLGLWIARKRDADTLRENEQCLRLLFENVGEAIVMINLYGVIRVWTPAAERLLGYSAGEAIGHPVTDRHFTELHDVLAAGTEAYESTEWWVRKDGSRFWAHVIARPIVDAGGVTSGYALVIRDLSAQRIAEQALQDRALVLERSNRELEEFASVAAHDLQEPLRKIRVFGERLRTRSATSLDETALRYLGSLDDATARMQRLIDDMLAYARVAIRTDPDERVDIQRIVQEVLRDFSMTIEKEQAQIEVGDLPVVSGNGSMLRQLFQNLIENAIKFHRKGERPQIKIWSRCVAGATGKRVVEINVADNGIGFDEKQTARIFKMLQRLHGRAEYEGTGMGLAICRRIAERHGGEITAKSTPDRGATFVVTLPLEGGDGDGTLDHDLDG
jgi:PAS domain S-box-containing protein